MEKVIEFLIKSKKETYAGSGREETVSSRPESHDLYFIDGDLKYIDTYLGSEKFAGEEALWENDIPFWAMNYAGRVLSEKFSGDFLKEALLNVQEDAPYRGPERYENGLYLYKCEVKGDFNWFNGLEEIFYDDVLVFECVFHGGIIKQ
ncbi:MAG: DUF5680 domain-containing protein [Oscillospiraceae bacterium]|nr:DUF5680 domain-containing protein [Oscillospiraceae bacterium]